MYGRLCRDRARFAKLNVLVLGSGLVRAFLNSSTSVPRLSRVSGPQGVDMRRLILDGVSPAGVFGVEPNLELAQAGEILFDDALEANVAKTALWTLAAADEWPPVDGAPDLIYSRTHVCKSACDRSVFGVAFCEGLGFDPIAETEYMQIFAYARLQLGRKSGGLGLFSGHASCGARYVEAWDGSTLTVVFVRVDWWSARTNCARGTALAPPLLLRRPPVILPRPRSRDGLSGPASLTLTSGCRDCAGPTPLPCTSSIGPPASRRVKHRPKNSLSPCGG